MAYIELVDRAIEDSANDETSVAPELKRRLTQPKVIKNFF